MKLQWKMKTKFGTLYLVASEKGLCGIHWSPQEHPFAKTLKSSEKRVKLLQETALQLEAYFRGDRQNFNLPLDLDGTSFQKSVWAQLRKIPYGKTCSYRDVARKIGSEKAVRAVGTANGRNPIPIIVPCHRVIASNGTLGGYSGGLPLKELLLKLENLGHPIQHEPIQHR